MIQQSSPSSPSRSHLPKNEWTKTTCNKAGTLRVSYPIQSPGSSTKQSPCPWGLICSLASGTILCPHFHPSSIPLFLVPPSQVQLPPVITLSLHGQFKLLPSEFRLATCVLSQPVSALPWSPVLGPGTIHLQLLPVCSPHRSHCSPRLSDLIPVHKAFCGFSVKGKL